jgi:glycosyltransferase involved in cell wall biosynthesis
MLTWTGKLPMDQAIDRMAAADALVSTSVLEATSLVTVEAISLGLPVLCHDACGMAVAITDDCGIKVPMVDPATSAAGYAAAIRRLADEPGLLERLSAGSLRRAKELTWDAIARTIAAGYDGVLSGVAGNQEGVQ